VWQVEAVADWLESSYAQLRVLVGEHSLKWLGRQSSKIIATSMHSSLSL
jgi:hypothetical protein